MPNPNTASRDAWCPNMGNRLQPAAIVSQRHVEGYIEIRSADAQMHSRWRVVESPAVGLRLVGWLN